jgi:hypothetical protein
MRRRHITTAVRQSVGELDGNLLRSEPDDPAVAGNIDAASGALVFAQGVTHTFADAA